MLFFLWFGQLDTTAALPPSVEASSRVIGMKAADSLVVNGDNFDLSTRLTFDPPLGSGFEMRVRRKTYIPNGCSGVRVLSVVASSTLGGVVRSLLFQFIPLVAEMCT